MSVGPGSSPLDAAVGRDLTLGIGAPTGMTEPFGYAAITDATGRRQVSGRRRPKGDPGDWARRRGTPARHTPTRGHAGPHAPRRSREHVGLRKQWRTSFLLMVAALVLALVGALVSFVQVVSGYQRAAGRLDQSITMTSELGAKITQHEGEAHRLWQGDPVDVAAYLRGQDDISAGFAQAGHMLTAPDEIQLLVRAETSWRAVLMVRGLWGPHLRASPVRLTAQMQAQFGAAADQVYENLDRLTNLALSDGSRDLKTADTFQDVVFVSLAMVFTLVLALMTYFARRMTRDIVRPLEVLREAAGRLRDGDLDHRVEVSARHRSNEVGELGDTLNAMAAALQDSHLDLSRKATYDALTGLVNRESFTGRLAAAVGADTGGSVAVLYIDLDDFKIVNDFLGHAAGDNLLIATAGRLSSCVASTDLVARLGGDEFAVLVTDATAAPAIATRILEAFTPPFEIDGQRVPVTVSIGISSAQANAAGVGDLLAEADYAMYTAKREGKGRHAVFPAAVQPA